MGIMYRKIKPCPFCGSEIKQFRYACHGDRVTWLEIDCCGLHTIDLENRLFYGSDGNIYIDEDAIDVWNRRDKGDA